MCEAMIVPFTVQMEKTDSETLMTSIQSVLCSFFPEWFLAWWLSKKQLTDVNIELKKPFIWL